MPVNEPVLNYAPGSPEKAALKKALAELKSQVRDLPMFIGGQRVTTTEKGTVRPPHERDHVLGHFSRGNATHVRAAIEAAMKAKPAWEAMPWQERAAIFLKAADLLTGPYRARMNAATMLCQSKNAFQAEIDAVCELADFWRFNAWFMQEIYKNQPLSVKKHLEPDRLAAAGRIRFCAYAFQFYLDCRQFAHGPRYAGQCRGLETC